MKARTQSILIILSSAIMLATACNTTADNQEATTSEAVQMPTSVAGTSLAIDTAASRIHWKGSKLIGDSHLGIVPITEGTVTVSEKGLETGTVTIDMKDLQPTDQDPESNAKLKAHLSSADFFSVDSFPTASFQIASITLDSSLSAIQQQANQAVPDIHPNSTVSGNLTIKGITKSISIPAEIHADSTSLQFKAAFSIDRTLWGINYGAENSVKDKIINKNIDFQLDINAKK